MSNREIARILAEISEYLAMQEESSFRVRAYEKAAEVITGTEEDVLGIYRRGGLKALEEIPGVGVSIAEKIEELLKTGRCRYHEQLKKKTPVNLSELSAIEGLGPKHIRRLYKELGVTNLQELEKAARVGEIKKLKGFGAKSEENILEGIEWRRKFGGRFILGFVMPFIQDIEERLRAFPGVAKALVAGSARRRKETIGDIDILVTAEAKIAPKIMEFFVSLPEVVEIFAQGETKSMVKFQNGLDADLRVVPEKSYGAALNYFTGSKDHNIALRELAIKKGLKLNEYGLFRGRRFIAGKTEEELYKALDLDYIEPELREMTGEIEAAVHGKLPPLVDYDDPRGDLQVQTNWTDGAHSIKEMAEAAAKAGLQYIAVTDHTKRLAMTGGLDERRLAQQGREIDKLNEQFKELKILKGTECDILKDGRLDLKDEALAKLDVVGISIHSHFNLPLKEQTERLMKAMRNPHADIVFHPTSRVLNKREGCALDMDKIIACAQETGTILEINAYPDRLDLKDEYIRRCVEAGVKMSIDSDSHSTSHFSVLEYGIAQARRGWATKEDIINVWPLEKMTSFLKDGK